MNNFLDGIVAVLFFLAIYAMIGWLIGDMSLETWKSSRNHGFWARVLFPVSSTFSEVGKMQGAMAHIPAYIGDERREEVYRRWQILIWPVRILFAIGFALWAAVLLCGLYVGFWLESSSDEPTSQSEMDSVR